MKQTIHTLLLMILLLAAPMALFAVSDDAIPAAEMQRIYEEVKSPYKYGMVVAPADNGHKIDCPTVFREGDKWYMTYVIYNGSDGLNGRGYTTWLSESDDLLHWTTLGCILNYKDQGWDMNQRGGFPSLIDWEWGGSYAINKYKNKYWMTYIGGEGTGYEGVRAPLFIGQAWTSESPAVAHEWQSADKPLLHINDKGAQWWEKLIQYKSTIYEDKAKTLGKRFVMFYNAGGINPQNDLKAERIGIALSNDMKTWKRYPGNPVFTHEAPGIITGDAQIVRMGDLYVMFYFSAYSPERKYNAFNTFAVSRDLVHWHDWTGPDLVYPTKPYDEMFAHKSYVVKHNGVVYHFYCAVNNAGQRGIALATSRPMGKSDVAFPEPERKGKRTILSLNEGWHTYLLGSDKPSLTVNLPHNWDDYYGYRQQKHSNLHGSAVYLRELNVEKDAAKRYFLQFDGVGTYATITLNGHTFTRHRPVGRTTFTLDITDHLQSGTNHLEVQCDHPELITDMPWVCGGCSSEWGFSEGSQPLGLFRPVSLVVTDEVRIEPFGVHVWNNAACDSLFVETEVCNYGSAEARFEVVNNFNLASGKRVCRLSDTISLKPGEARVVLQKAHLDSPTLWSIEEPYLYNLVSMVKRDGKTTDQIETPYGIRSIEWQRDPSQAAPGFFLNGKRVLINGTCEYDHLLGGGHAFSPEQIASRIKLIRQAGFNAWREAHQPHALLYQQLLDKEGLLSWSQFSAHVWYDTPAFRNNFKQLLRQWVKERRNSTSLILWGIQNESTLPKDFTEECRQIIHEMDPMHRLTTTCNGGEGSDWNVIQNWSGTYGGSALNYDVEMKQPKQLLNGEYGAWRTVGLHSEANTEALRQEKSYSEERATDILETKIRLAEEARDSICGHFQWIFNTHDNPGRVQPDEGYRMIDKIGPMNYKGLITAWEQPADMYYMYRSNYVSADDDPMVYIVSHTWADRFKESGARRADISVYSNCDSVCLYNDADPMDGGVSRGTFLGRKRNHGKPGTHLLWENREIKWNVLRAVGYRNGVAVAEDVIILEGLPEAPSFQNLYLPSSVVPVAADNNREILKPKEQRNYVFRMNCGGDEYTDSYGNKWMTDTKMYSHSWGEEHGVDPYMASQTSIPEPIHGTKDWPLFQTMRYGRHKLYYEVPLENGIYDVELYFAEPWLGTGGGIKTDCEGERLFSVDVNGARVNDIDLWASAGHAGAYKVEIEASVTDGKLCISFPEVKVAQAVISAIAISTANMEAKPVEPTTEKSLWSELDKARIDKLPKELLPSDEEAFPATRYVPMVKNKQALPQWIITPGVAREYALRFRYKNTAQPVVAQMEIIDQKGIVLVQCPMTFPTTPNKFKIVSTTTGTQINAGVYTLRLLDPATLNPLNGVEFEYVEVQ